MRLTNAYVVNCDDTDSIKYMLTQKHLSAVIGFALNVEDIKKVTIDGKEITTIYNDGTSYIAGHAVALIGYDDDFSPLPILTTRRSLRTAHGYARTAGVPPRTTMVWSGCHTRTHHSIRH